MGGNIGRGVLDLDPPAPGEVIVLELSSYQTDLARALAPDVAVFLNLSPDHLDRHGGLGGYFAAKRRLFELGAPERAVIGVDEPEGRFLANLAESGSGSRRRTWSARVLWAVWVLAVLASARPQHVGEPLALPISGRDLLLAVDLSGSMEEQDFVLFGSPVDRLTATKAVAEQFVDFAVAFVGRAIRQEVGHFVRRWQRTGQIDTHATKEVFVATNVRRDDAQLAQLVDDQTI